LPNTGGEILVRWQVGNSSDTAGAVLRMTAAASSYYDVRFDGARHVELFGQCGGALHTDLGGVRVSSTPGTAKQWFRFRAQGTNLYYKVWADGTTEPTNLPDVAGQTRNKPRGIFRFVCD
jgi:hypothetical protein